MILRMASHERDRGLGAAGLAVGVPVGALQRHRRRVIVQLRAVEGERCHHVEHQAVEQAGPIGVEQRDERPADTIVVQEAHLVG